MGRLARKMKKSRKILIADAEFWGKETLVEAALFTFFSKQIGEKVIARICPFQQPINTTDEDLTNNYSDGHQRQDHTDDHVQIKQRQRQQRGSARVMKKRRQSRIAKVSALSKLRHIYKIPPRYYTRSTAMDV